MKQFIIQNWFKLIITVVIVAVGAAIIYYLAIFIPEKERLNREARLKDVLAKEVADVNKAKNDCKDEGMKLYKLEQSYYGEGKVFEPKYNYNTELKKCLYSGGGYTSSTSWERHVKDVATNQDIISTYNFDTKQGSNEARLDDIKEYWDQEHQLMDVE